MTATGAPASASALEIILPATGCRPSTSKKSPATVAVRTRSMVPSVRMADSGPPE